MNASELIDKRIRELSDPLHSEASWLGQIFAQLRRLILESDPNIKEEWKWDTGVWTHNGLVCAVGAMKSAVKLNFFKGADLPDPHKLFNAGLDAKKTRAIDFHEGDKINEQALKEIIRSAIAHNAK